VIGFMTQNEELRCWWFRRNPSRWIQHQMRGSEMKLEALESVVDFDLFCWGAKYS